MDLNQPSPEEVARYQKEWESSQKYKYVPRERNLLKLFETYPKNVSLKDVLYKVEELNGAYNTRIPLIHIELVAEHIVDLNIDHRLANQDLDLVNDIAKNEKTKNNYVFATKYCSFHFPEKFPIYDRLVAKTLWHFYREDRYASYFSRGDLRDYQTFYFVLLDFIEFYGLEEFNYKEIDHYLWLVGQEL